jgi:hypothetical protein
MNLARTYKKEDQDMNALKSRLHAHFAACAAAAAATAVATPQADAAIVYSGPVNIAIPNNIDGVYMNVVTGANGSTPVAGYDINPYSALAGNFNLWGPAANTWLDTGTDAYNLSVGTVIGAAGVYDRPGGGVNVGTQMNLNSSNNYLGFRFVNEANGNQVHYGWIQLQFGADAGTRSIIGYAYEDVAGGSIEAGVVPAPGALALLGLAGVIGGRRRRA